MKKIIRLLILPAFLVAALSSCTNYGKKVSKDYLEIYYKDGVTKDQAQKMLDFLYPYWKESDKPNRKSVQLLKVKDTITFRMVTNKDKLKETSDDTFYSMGVIFSDSVFNSVPVNIETADKYFKPLHTYRFGKQ